MGTPEEVQLSQDMRTAYKASSKGEPIPDRISTEVLKKTREQIEAEQVPGYALSTLGVGVGIAAAFFGWPLVVPAVVVGAGVAAGGMWLARSSHRHAEQLGSAIQERAASEARSISE